MKKDDMISGVAARYAGALYDLAQEQNKVADVATELAALKTLLDEGGDFAQFIASPLYSADAQANVIKTIADKFKMSALTSQFLNTLAANRRLNLLQETAIGFKRLMDEKQGIGKAEIISAETLSEQQITALKSALKETTGQTVELVTHVDKSLIGGMVVKLGSRMVDTSLKTKLSQLKIALKGVA